jgi:hypothetical protein
MISPDHWYGYDETTGKFVLWAKSLDGALAIARISVHDALTMGATVMHVMDEQAART